MNLGKLGLFVDGIKAHGVCSLYLVHHVLGSRCGLCMRVGKIRRGCFHVPTTEMFVAGLLCAFCQRITNGLLLACRNLLVQLEVVPAHLVASRNPCHVDRKSMSGGPEYVGSKHFSRTTGSSFQNGQT